MSEVDATVKLDEKDHDPKKKSKLTFFSNYRNI